MRKEAVEVGGKGYKKTKQQAWKDRDRDNSGIRNPQSVESRHVGGGDVTSNGTDDKWNGRSR